MERKSMNRKWTTWMVVVPLLLTFAYGCPKKKPATPPATGLDVETQSVETPAPPAQEVRETPPPVTEDEVEDDPLASADLQRVNDELRRRGFSPDVYFEYDESSLSDEARERLARNAELLRAQPQFLVTIEGHADERGTNEYNLALGDKRANAVRDYLSSLGVDGGRLRTLSYGEERPVCTTSEESCWSQNRRGHLIITGRANVG
jgi:peptidoglycan-associated lipoprotein